MKEGYALYRKRLPVILRIAALEIVVVVLMLAFGAGLLVGGAVAFVGALTVSKVALASVIILSAIVIVAYLLLAFWLCSWISLALMQVLRAAEELTLPEAFHRARPQAWPLVGIGALFILLMLGTLLVGGVLPGAIVFGILFSLISMKVAAIIAIVIGVITTMISFATVSTWYGFTIWSLVEEDARGTEAFRKSRALVRGRFWRVFGRMLLISLCVAAVSIAVSIVCSILFMGLGKDAAGGVRSLISQLVNVFFVYPVVTAATYSFYKALRHPTP